MGSNFLFKHRPSWILSSYRILFTFGILIELLFDKQSIFDRSNSPLCYPIPIFSMLSIPILDEKNIQFYFYVLLASLISLSIGLFSRFSAFAATLLFFWVMGSTLSCANGKNPDYINWQHAIVIFNLIILSFANSGNNFSIDSLFLKSRNSFSWNWPIFLLKFNLAYSYFSGGVAKIQNGFDWMNGYSLQGHLIYSHLHIETPLVLPFISDLTFLKIISILVVFSELAFLFVLANPTFAVICVGGSLVFQFIFFFLIKLRWMHYFGWSYTIYFLELIAFFVFKYKKNKSNSR